MAPTERAGIREGSRVVADEYASLRRWEQVGQVGAQAEQHGGQ